MTEETAAADTAELVEETDEDEVEVIIDERDADDYDVPDGITVVTDDVPNLNPHTRGIVVDAGEQLRVEVGQTAGNSVWTDAQYFVALKTKQELGEMEKQLQAMQSGQDPDEIDDIVDEASLFISNEDGDVGAGLIRQETADVEEVLEEFADSIENGELLIDFPEDEIEEADIPDEVDEE